ncbi:hypothetical protein [Pseudarthrobacter sp. YAF2]|uniref:hypothetical protein n=1 Tax=Pseudarthrobacter sp. YAF2 TaxID=3233078 RepID=UPI003F9961D6
MFWGISEAWWMQIWSGVIGAIVAAVVSVAVALIVVGKTNAHQSVIAGRAMAEQRMRDASALAQQRLRDAEALELQRAALREQLDLQRSETSRLRLMDIRADVVSATSGLIDAARESSGAVNAATRPLEHAINRWRVESEDDSLVEELMYWPGFLRRLALEYALSLKQKKDEEASFDRLGHAVSMLSVMALHMARSDYFQVQYMPKGLADCRKNLEAELDALDANLTDATN